MTFVDPTEATRSGIEEVITSTIGNRVTAKNRPRVRIPPTPPKPRTFYVRGFPFCLMKTPGCAGEFKKSFSVPYEEKTPFDTI